MSSRSMKGGSVGRASIGLSLGLFVLLANAPVAAAGMEPIFPADARLKQPITVTRPRVYLGENLRM